MAASRANAVRHSVIRAPVVALPFILASNSPRRHALLAEAGYEFEVVGPPISQLIRSSRWKGRSLASPVT
ncbi:MAG: hypothetical protein DME40_16045 [Verrucomicrobia bacterium]|nr:MAG: hypothetical protein DME40_16045 [Verrucomicrobiota bacterium]